MLGFRVGGCEGLGLGFWAFYGDACRVSNHILFPGTIVMPACMFDNSILRVKAIRLIMSVSVCVCVSNHN